MWIVFLLMILVMVSLIIQYGFDIKIAILPCLLTLAGWSGLHLRNMAIKVADTFVKTKVEAVSL